MRFYYIKDDYITFLRKYDARVAENKKEARPYVGVVLEISGIKYYAPFTSPKPKHMAMKNGKDFRKINQGKYGAINFNNMIPVVDEALIEINIANINDLKYKTLLQNQLSCVRADRIQIEKTAVRLRKLILTDKENLNRHDAQIKARCCDLKVLEARYLEYVSDVGGKHDFGTLY